MGVWSQVKSKAKEWKKEQKYKRAASKEIKKQATAAYYKASAKERVAYAQAKAKVERERRVKKLKASYAPRKPINFRAISMFGNGQPSSFEPSGIMSPSSAQPSKPRRTKTRKVKRRRKVSRRKAKSKYIIRGGKAYPIG